MGLMADLGGGPVGVDTAIFIYFIEEHARFLPLVEQLFTEVSEGRKELVTSALTLLEVLVVPYRSGDHLLAGRYEALLTQSRGVHVADISRDHLRAAAQLRAATGVKTPDSLQVVAALAAGCTAFLTNDRDLPTIPGLRILQLSSYLRKHSCRRATSFSSTPSSIILSLPDPGALTQMHIAARAEIAPLQFHL